MEVRRLPNFVKNDDLQLYHHGIKGQRWGVRRYQNADGSLTEAGRKHYSVGETVKKGAKVGGIIGTVVNGGIMAAALGVLATTGVGTVPAAVAAGQIATQAALGAMAGINLGAFTGVGIGLGRQYSAKKKGIDIGDLDDSKKNADFNKKWESKLDKDTVAFTKQEEEWQKKYNSKKKTIT